MAVEGLPGHPEFPAEIADHRLGLSHAGHGQSDLGGGHREGPPSLAAPGSSSN